MSEGWAIAVIGGVFALFMAALSLAAHFIGKSLDTLSIQVGKLTDALNQYVVKTDCQSDMCTHRDQIEMLRKRVTQNEMNITGLQTEAKLRHKEL